MTDFELLQEILATMKPVQLRVFLVCQFAIAQFPDTSAGEIARVAGIGDRAKVGQALDFLEKRDYIRRIRLEGLGFRLIWVKTSAMEKPPADSTVKYQERNLAYHVRSPRGTIHHILPGKIREFCQHNNVNYQVLSKVIRGDRKSKTVDGWTVISSQ